MSIRAAFVFVLSCLAFSLSGSSLQWEKGAGYRLAPLSLPGSGRDGFTLMAGEQTGIRFTNFVAEERIMASQILPNGSGVAAGDVDGDGWCDLYFCGLKTGNRLYRNLGNWKFEDITERAGVACPNLDATGAALVDIDGDGDLDLIVNSIGGGTHVFFNDGHGRFIESKEVLNSGKGGTSLSLADFDGDGKLDLYIANYRANSEADRPDLNFNLRMVDNRLTVVSINGKPLTDPEWTNRFRFQVRDDGKGTLKFSHEELGEPDVLYRNLGGGRFEPVSWTTGTFLDEAGKPLKEPPLDWGLSVMFRDLNGDGKPDLYICNDFTTPDRIWINQGNGHFQAIANLAIRQTPLSCMAMDVADVNRDGNDDIFTGDMLSRLHRRRLVQRTNLRPETLPLGGLQSRPQYARNMLQLNRGDGTYAEIAQYAGLEAAEWLWTPIFLDVDLDGYEDLIVANGFARDNMNLDSMAAAGRVLAGHRGSLAALVESRRQFARLPTENLAFHNLGGGKFEEMGRAWRFDTKTISQGMCLADLDNDGDLDVVVNNLYDQAGVYRNDSVKPRVAVVLKGQAPNTQGIGARIRVYGGAVPMQSQELMSGGRYLSCDAAMRVFAVGSLSNDLRIEVDWSNGTRSTVSHAKANYIYEIDQAGAEATVALKPSPAIPWFEDVSRSLGHSHHEDEFNDFALQPTLSKRLSQLGPGVCWCDLDGDGWDDLAIGTGQGGSFSVYLNKGRQGFQPMRTRFSEQSVARDETTVLALPRGTNGTVLLLGSANYEDGKAEGASVFAYDPLLDKVLDAVPGFDASVGPLALGDIDGDGNLDLFVGARVRARAYPQAVSSRILRNQNGAFVLDEANSKLLDGVGMVSAALWSDLDGDGFPELILACEWGPIRVFHNDHGRLSGWNLPVTPAPGDRKPRGQHELSHLSEYSGWWNGITTGDLDGDGRLDIIAGNWGQNTKYESHRAAPLRLYYADVNQDGAYGLLEAFFDPETGKYVPERRLDNVAGGMPFLLGRFSSNQAYAQAGIDELLGEFLPQARYVEAAWLESTVFLNHGESWETRILPPEAQFSPAFAVLVADFDGDGHEDLFLSQNFFAVEPETSRYDAGRGLWLKGDGRGNLRPVPGAESGVMVYGEQRGAAVADFDGDGRVDLVVTQNAAETRLFRNVRARPGLRVRLKGPAGNPWGLGAQLRLKHGSRVGPVREVHGGSGYWSMDSPVQVLGDADPPVQLWVRWPGGRAFSLDVPAGATEIQVGIDGNLTLLKSRQP